VSEINTEPHPYSDMTLLCVDDEASILRTMQRLFRNKPYEIVIAESGEQALLIMQEQPIDLIISDMRMQGMDGPTLLEKSAQLYPKMCRIVLSGYADFESTVAAVNLGKINRFINKPWNNNELINVVEECLESIKLKKENNQLKLKISQKNEQLKLWNQELEEKINLRTKQILASLKRNERNNKATEKMLFNFIAINSNLNGDFAKNVGNLAGRMASKLGLDKSDINDIRLAGFLTEIGMLGLDEKICTTPYNLLNYDQKTEFLGQGKIAQQILSPAHHMNNVLDMICNQYESLDVIATLGNNVAQQGSRILRVARDYWRYAYGKIAPEKLEYRHVCIELNKGKNIKYDQELLGILESNPELVEDGVVEQGINSQQLLAGMLLKHNLYSTNRLLILAEGHEFSESSIDKLIEYEINQKHIFSIVIEKFTNQQKLIKD